MNKIETLNSFWAQFGLKAYDENSVPDGAVLPYMTYESSDDDFDHPVALTASLWYRSSSWKEITLKELEIADFIGRGGVLVNYDGGALWIKKGNPFAQRMPDSSDDSIRRIVMNIEVEFLD